MHPTLLKTCECYHLDYVDYGMKDMCRTRNHFGELF